MADWLGKPAHAGGLAVGSGLVSVILGLLILASVVYLAVTGKDVPDDPVPVSLAVR